MLNYEIDSAVLSPYVPRGTELDFWNGKAYVSMVGFQFLNTRVFGVSIPWHCHFDEVNLRFYVRRRAEEGWRRGVVFLKEIVPRAAIAVVARTLYHEPYVALPMEHQIDLGTDGGRSVKYSWRLAGRQQYLFLHTASDWERLPEGSEAEFITEHYWGYNAQPDKTTLEYRVEHPRWRVATATTAHLDCTVATLYGEAFCESLPSRPSSAFLAEGSAVSVYRGNRLVS